MCQMNTNCKVTSLQLTESFQSTTVYSPSTSRSRPQLLLQLGNLTKLCAFSCSLPALKECQTDTSTNTVSISPKNIQLPKKQNHTTVKTSPFLFFKEKYSSLNTKHELKTSEEQFLLPWSAFN